MDNYFVGGTSGKWKVEKRGWGESMSEVLYAYVWKSHNETHIKFERKLKKEGCGEVW
jgi:hypothetical protein